MPTKPDNETAANFLLKWAPEGPWVLTSIEPDRYGIETQTFRPATMSAMGKWLKKWNGKRNIYFHVNPVQGDVTKKPEREDILEMAWLHVDIDPRVGEDIEEERKRALALLEDPPGDVPPPTAIIFSGGGYQGFWKLEDPVPINGDLAAAEDAKHYNIQLEVVFGADHCHNVDRIMRLPGTVNIPDAKKRKKGRTKVTAELVTFDTSRTYRLDQFTKAQQIQASDDGFSGGLVKVSGNVQRVNVHDPEAANYLDNYVGKGVTVPDPDWLKVLIVQGHDPDDPTKYPSRSEVLFAVVCELVRRKVPDDIIYSILTDPVYEISSSVLDKRSGSERYALRQIERAHENAIDPQLMKMNERHAVIGNLGGKCRVIEEDFDPVMDRNRFVNQTFGDFKNRYMNRYVQSGWKDKDHQVPRMVPLGKWWLEHQQRRQYDKLVFAPSRDVPGAYNLWRGFACEARPTGSCDKFLEHVRENICDGHDAHYQYLIRWLARCVQKPDSPGQVAVVMRGDPGTGKSFFAKSFGKLWGRHFMQVSDPKHLVGSFNNHLRDCVVLFGDEAFYAGDKKHESILKTLITEDTLTIEAKGVDVEVSPNFLHIIMASNSAWVIPAMRKERRFFVLDVNPRRMRDHQFFKRIQKELDNGGYEALLHHLLTYDLEGFNVRDYPLTDALAEQKLLSMSPEEEWWFRKLEEGKLLDAHSGWLERATKKALTDDYHLYAKKLGVYRPANTTALSLFFKRVLPAGWPKSKQVWVERTVEDYGGEETRTIRTRPYHWLFPPLAACRVAWDDAFNYGYGSDWPDEVEEETSYDDDDAF